MGDDGHSLQVDTSLFLGVQLGEFDFRLFLREYYRDLRKRVGEQTLPAYDPDVVLDELIPNFDSNGDRSDTRRAALQAFARRAYRLDLALAGADYGPLERRTSPYAFDRVFYHIGLEVVSASIRMDAPGHNPYRSTRKLDVPFVREHVSDLLAFLPDYLWWEIHDKTDVIQNVLAPEQLHDVRKRIERTGCELDSFGLYLTTMETIEVD